MNWLKENWFKIGLLVTTTIVAFSVAYYYTILLPQQEQVKIDLQIQDRNKKISDEQALIGAENQKRILLQLCFDEAYTKYTKSAQYWLDNRDKIGDTNTVEMIEKEKR